jgi:hypothetical protein
MAGMDVTKSSYLRTLGETLDKEINFFWTVREKGKREKERKERKERERERKKEPNFSTVFYLNSRREMRSSPPQ